MPLKMDKELKIQVDNFKENISKEAEELVTIFFPKKCMELDQFLQSDVLQLKDIGSIHKPLNIATPEVSSNNNTGNGSDAKKRKLNESGDECRGLVTGDAKSKIFVFPNGPVPSNEKLLKVIEFLKPEVVTLVEKCNTVRMWVTLLIPKIEDGNNFGVQIQVTNFLLDSFSKSLIIL